MSAFDLTEVSVEEAHCRPPPKLPDCRGHSIRILDQANQDVGVNGSHAAS